MALRGRADDGPLIVVFGSSLPLSTKKRHNWTPSDKKFLIRAYADSSFALISLEKNELIAVP